MVDFREYVMAISMLIEGSAVEKLCWSFKLYDKDRDGAITKEEMLEIMQVSCCLKFFFPESDAHVQVMTNHTLFIYDTPTDSAPFNTFQQVCVFFFLHRLCIR